MPTEVHFGSPQPVRDDRHCADCKDPGQPDLELYWWWDADGSPVVLCSGCWTRRHQVVAE